MICGARLSLDPVIVHLVHGTWPFGPFGRLFGAKKAWLEDGSPFRKAVESLTDRPLEFRPFQWSGRNSVMARLNASEKLAHDLEELQKDQPSARHVIIAHSHGGTVAAMALQARPTWDDRQPLPEIKALICLATPFTYVSRSYDQNLFSIALGSISGAMIALALTPLWTTWWFLLLMLFLVGWPVGPFLIWLSRADFPDGRYYSNMIVQPDMPTFIIRGTRDEANLTIGFAQSLNAFLSLFYRSFDEVPKFDSLPSWLLKVVAMLVGLLLAGAVLRSISAYVDYPDTGMLQDAFLFLLFGAASFGTIFIAGYSLIAFAVGFYNPARWPWSVIEVDSSLPDKECSIKCYHDLDDIEPTAMRHGIYELLAVQADIALVVQAVADDRRPRLATAQEMRDTLKLYQEAYGHRQWLARKGLNRSAIETLDDPRPSYDRVVFHRYIKSGDVLNLQDDVEGALKEYKMASRIAGGIATRDPGNVDWNRHLWESYNKIGKLLVARQRTPEALEHYQTAMKFAENLAAKHPQFTDWSALAESMNAKIHQTVTEML
jgi:pimeloyl-ACP methyl ester carboxylesterase